MMNASKLEDYGSLVHLYFYCKKIGYSKYSMMFVNKTNAL